MGVVHTMIKQKNQRFYIYIYISFLGNYPFKRRKYMCFFFYNFILSSFLKKLSWKSKSEKLKDIFIYEIKRIFTLKKKEKKKEDSFCFIHSIVSYLMKQYNNLISIKKTNDESFDLCINVYISLWNKILIYFLIIIKYKKIKLGSSGVTRTSESTAVACNSLSL